MSALQAESKESELPFAPFADAVGTSLLSVCGDTSSFEDSLAVTLEDLLIPSPPESERFSWFPLEGTTENSFFDEPAAFIRHINSCASPKLSCDSPSEITSLLMTPKTKVKNLSRPAAKRKAETAPPEATREVERHTPPTAPVVEIVARETVDTTPASESSGASERAPAAPSSGSDEQRKNMRMERNRASAAQSRQRKKQKVETLEAELEELKNIVATLKKQNVELRRENAAAAMVVETTKLPSANLAACA